jgi:hypothetical protein
MQLLQGSAVITAVRRVHLYHELTGPPGLHVCLELAGGRLLLA